MDETGGWTIWCKSRERIRQFSVALPSGIDAVAALRAENPDLAVLTKHSMNHVTLADLGMAYGDITEWIPLDCKQKVIRINDLPTC
jgi:hypothetical protein